jgi:pimeloyl-ACP methyl ester carboxylesterase
MNNPLAIDMHFREQGQDVTVKALNLQERLSSNGKHVVVFVHGLMGEESLWQKISPTESKPKYGTLLEQDLGITPLYIRYNSGLRISENGKKLNQLLEELITVYGKYIERITLIGYSMGGLVVRSAGYYSDKTQRNWLRKLSTVVLISVPNEGSYLAQLGHFTTLILRGIPSVPTHLTAHIIDKRSSGMKDLRHGFMVEEDWKNQETHPASSARRTIVGLLPGVTYHMIAGTMVKDEASLVALFFGDGLVGKQSAMGGASFNHTTHLSKFVTYRIFPKMNHATILTNPEVYNHLRTLLLAQSWIF